MENILLPHSMQYQYGLYLVKIAESTLKRMCTAFEENQFNGSGSKIDCKVYSRHPDNK